MQGDLSSAQKKLIAVSRRLHFLLFIQLLLVIIVGSHRRLSAAAEMSSWTCGDLQDKHNFFCDRPRPNQKRTARLAVSDTGMH